jgi:tRNA(Arg) A34 adenosine deaminase TadA
MDSFDQKQAEKFMRRAIELGRKGAQHGDGGPFGAIIVKNGEIIGEGWNRVILSNDPTAHGEIMAIRDACRHLSSYDLTGSEIYTSGQPCPMCLGAIYWARLNRIFYGFGIQDAAGACFDDQFIFEELHRPSTQRLIPEIQLLKTEALQVLSDYTANPERIKY